MWALREGKQGASAVAGYREGSAPPDARLELSWRWGSARGHRATWAGFTVMALWLATACLWPRQPAYLWDEPEAWACWSMGILPVPILAFLLVLLKRDGRRPAVVATHAWLLAWPGYGEEPVQVPATSVARLALVPPFRYVKQLGQDPASLRVERSDHGSTVLFELPAEGELDDLRYVARRLARHLAVPFVDGTRGADSETYG